MPGGGLQQVIDGAPVGSAVCLSPGVYQGPVVISTSLTLWGGRAAVIQSNGQGSTITIHADHVQLLGFTIRGSGNRFDLNDSALKVTGSHILIQGLRLEGVLFGLTAEKSTEVTFRGNDLAGDLQKPLGLRGDAVRLWETRDSIVEGNRITGCRDIIIWYSSHDRVAGNLIYGGRYGTHFMYSDAQEVVGNRYERDVVGIFTMYAHGVVMRHNVIEDSAQYEGMGIGVKDSDGLVAENNLVVHDNTGIYLDASPPSPSLHNDFSRNLIALNHTGVVFHASESNTSFTGNSFRDNQAVASVEGNGNALAVEWNGNFFDDYQGYDLNHDGVGDVPYELRSFSTELVDHYPMLAFFRGSPAMSLMEFSSKVFPYLQPRLMLRDPSPRMKPPAIQGDSL
jgi:nitrous oxidase accessory protein